jgi:hypothetical protein
LLIRHFIKVALDEQLKKSFLILEEKRKNHQRFQSLILILLSFFILTSCSGVIPPPPPPSEHGEIADSHKVTAIKPFYEIEENIGYCLISKGVIVTNYESSQKVLTQ